MWIVFDNNSKNSKASHQIHTYTQIHIHTRVGVKINNRINSLLISYMAKQIYNGVHIIGKIVIIYDNNNIKRNNK